jgi:hypothetical protein
VPDTTGVTAITNRTKHHRSTLLDHINAFEPSTLNLVGRAGLIPVKKPLATVATESVRVARDFAKTALKQSNTTQRYFRLAAEPKRQVSAVAQPIPETARPTFCMPCRDDTWCGSKRADCRP